MKGPIDLPPRPQERGELLAAIKRLAHQRFIQLELGPDADFEKLWSDAFFASETSEPIDKKVSTITTQNLKLGQVFPNKPS